MTASPRNELRASPFFRHLPADALARVSPAIQRKSYGRGQLVFQQGEPAGGFFVILAGKVKLRVCSGTGKEQVLHFFEAGDSFGEAAILAGEGYPADAVTLSESRMVYIPAEPFLDEMRADPDFAFLVMRSMARRLTEFAQIIENLSTREVRARLASYILSQRRRGGESPSLRLPVGKGELACLLGTTAESLSRALRNLSEQGMIRVEGKMITVIDPDALIELAED